MGEAIDIFRLSGMKYPIHILASTFSTVSDVSGNLSQMPKGKDLKRKSIRAGAGKAI